MELPWKDLKPETLRALIEEIVSRDGTDYGPQEKTLEAKLDQVYRLLREKKAKLVFDSESETCDIREVETSKLGTL